ncbi:MAG TPA: methyltransferase, TIGR04325 family [Rhizomicrobium sp.]|nr:methyltransferase, TIGR04325 family [Rhizomicrobium sp.]
MNAPFYDSDVWQTSEWLTRCERAARRLGVGTDKGTLQYRLENRIRLLLFGHRAPRPLQPLKAVLETLAQRRRVVRIVDYGGSVGDNFFHLAQTLPHLLPNLSYYIVDNPRSCELGRRLFASSPYRPTFCEEWGREPFDLAILCGSLQYIPDWRSLLSSLKEKSSFIYLTRSPITEGETFAYRQPIATTYIANGSRFAGHARSSVLSRRDLESTMSPMKLIARKHLRNYSVPGDANAVYECLLWSHS